jgi:hypothetical protein
VLTFVESISLAGDRAKQNDDAFGFVGARAWVLDGATDLHDAPLSGTASDAAWIAHFANARLHCDGGDAREAVRAASEAAAAAFAALTGGRAYEAWQAPIASLLMVDETGEGVAGIDLGDCRMFALGADGAVHIAGGRADAADQESKLAAQQTDTEKPLLRREATLAKLRANRALMNRPEPGYWTFCIDPWCADQARSWSFALTRPAHVLLMSDGFAALTDRYGAYDGVGLVRAAIEKGLQELGRELRAIEAADAGGALHPRFKRSDDATALLLRLT